MEIIVFLSIVIAVGAVLTSIAVSYTHLSTCKFFSSSRHRIAVEWHQSSFAARTGFQEWSTFGFDRCGIQAAVFVYAKPEHGTDKGANFR